MFSKALFKQSCKANGVMWIIITFAVCLMLSCVMLISGSGNIGKVKNSLEDTIITAEINANIEKRSINYYSIGTDGLKQYDKLFVQNYQSLSTYAGSVDTWFAGQPSEEQFPAYTNTVQGLYAQTFNSWLAQKPTKTGEMTDEQYSQLIAGWMAKKPSQSSTDVLAKVCYMATASDLQTYEQQKALEVNKDYVAGSDESNEIVGAAICALDPTLNESISELYTTNNIDIPASYDVQSLLAHLSAGDIGTYLSSSERVEYIQDRTQIASGVYIAGNMTTEKNINQLVEVLSGYGVTKEKYDNFGYTFENINHKSQTTLISFQGRYDYELGLIDEEFPTPEQKASEEYANAIKAMVADLTADLSDSLLASLPQDVSSALEEVGQMDLYSLIVGSIFYKMAGLLLPIIYMIMASNNLIAGQVDSGSMAYILSTSTKRKQVTFTQGLFLAGSLFVMFCCTTITSCVCLAILNNPSLQLTYGKLILLNLGAFVTLFAMSGICFLASCWFDRSKNSMSIGGGLSMFFLVATMLGLFGSKVIPSVVRLDALNYFNYVSIISLFDVISIISGGITFIWKLAILLVIGFAGYILGSIKFEKKDLPL